MSKIMEITKNDDQ